MRELKIYSISVTAKDSREGEKQVIRQSVKEAIRILHLIKTTSNTTSSNRKTLEYVCVTQKRVERVRKLTERYGGREQKML